MDIGQIFKTRQRMREKRGMLKFFTDEHPELQKGEIFLCTANEGIWECIDLETKRRGKYACDYTGKEIRDKSFFPVFVLTRELRERKVKYKFRFKW